MTFWEFVGDLGEILLYGSIGLCVVIAVLGIVSTVMQDVRRARWEERSEAMVEEFDRLLLERHMATCLGQHRTLAARLSEDDEVASLEAQFDLPSAPGSWYR